MSGLFSGEISVYKNQKKFVTQKLSLLPINCVKMVDNFVYAGSEDTKVYLLKLGKTLQTTHVLDTLKDPVTSIDTHPLNASQICVAAGS